MGIFQCIDELIRYGIRTELISEDDSVYVRNRILSLLKLDSYEEEEGAGSLTNRGDKDLEEILKGLLDYAFETGVLSDNGQVSRDLFDTALMDCMVMPPSFVRRKFYELYSESPKSATDWYYRFSCDTDYIRRYRIAKDIKWKTKTVYGELDITINLSKPEKDPKAIAAAGRTRSVSYPKCLLCVENEGYAGRADHPARQNHRIIPVEIAGFDFYLQYSPYVYYNEHCIVFNKEHVPMKIDRDAFKKLFGFVEKFPHYTIGSNADLPIVGGSILSHDHFQGGNYDFPMAGAEILRSFEVKGFEGVECSVLKWPLSVIRIKHEEAGKLIDLADHILSSWRRYSDPEAFIFAETEGVPHNTITPIVRRRDKKYEMDLTLRNNITTEECPLGVYHPHNELHHIKKENIGLIEVMGLAILPSRLRKEMEVLKERMLSGSSLRDDPVTEKHADWGEDILSRHAGLNPDNIDGVIREEIGLVFMRVLEDAGVYKQTDEGQEALKRFTDSL